MICVGYRRFFITYVLVIIVSMVTCQGQNRGGTQWQSNGAPAASQGRQGWSVNAIPDENGNWRTVDGSEDKQPSGPFNGNEPPMRVNSDFSSMSNNEEKPPRPMRVNGQPNRAQQLLNRLPHAKGPMKYFMRGLPGRNGTRMNGTNDMRNMMRNIMSKGKGAMKKILESIKSQNGSMIVIRQPRQFIPSACAQEMLQIQTDCFSKIGYSMDAFFHTLRNGSFSFDGPSTAISSLKTELCEKRQAILDCAIPAIIGKRDKPPCLDTHDYNFGEEMALKGIRIVQDICKAGLLPPAPICVPLVNREMQRCYTKVGFSPDMFISNDSNVEGAVIGKDFNSANKFCGARKQLYACMRLVMQNCPDAKEHLLVSGHDQGAIEKSIDVLCDNKRVYVEGLNCFQTPSETVHNCIDLMSSQTLDLEANQMWKSMSKADFYKEFCRIRVEHMECDTTAWKESCHKVTVGLKNEFQCAMLPNICHNITEIDDILHNKVCKREAYLQALRSPYSSATSVFTSWVMPSIVTAALSLIIIF